MRQDSAELMDQGLDGVAAECPAVVWTVVIELRLGKDQSGVLQAKE